MRLPIEPPLEPQLARSQDTVPTEPGWSHERKWDGFRCVLFTDGEERFLQSRNGRPLDRYFPEVTPAPGRYVLDGELVVFGDDGNENFERLQERIHPARSRVERLAAETPARYVAFDLLALDDRSLLDLPFSERRALLEQHLPEGAKLTPLVATAAEADVWLQTAEGVISKDESAPYLPGKRAGMAKIKRVRTIDAVVIGWREHKHGGAGSLMLGLHGEDGKMVPIGHTSGWPRPRARELAELVGPYETGETYDDGPNRWTSASGRNTAFRILRPELVVEVNFDHRSGGRIRHGARLERIRDDRDPETCLLDQLDS